MSKVNIVIPVYNHWDLVHKQLWDLYNKEFDNIDSILIVNDCSPDPTVKNGITWWTNNGMLPVSGITTEQNSGFLITSNLGLRTVNENPEDTTILLSSDVLINGKFIQQIKDTLEAIPKSLVGGILLDKDTGWNKFGDTVYPYLEGWLLATTNENWKELGNLDVRYAESDYEDVDLSTTATSLGYKLSHLNTPSLHHLGGQSIGYNPTRLERTNRNKKKFEAKWVTK